MSSRPSVVGRRSSVGDHRPSDYLHGLELGNDLSRRNAVRQSAQLRFEIDLQAVRHEDHEEVCLDAWLTGVLDRTHRQVVLDHGGDAS